MTCKDCIHEDLCKDRLSKQGYTMYADKNLIVEDCEFFKNKADFVEVVRCKDCKHWRTEHGGFCEASNALCEVNNANTDFCSYGERK